MIEQLLTQRPQQVRIVYRHLPLRSIHSFAEPAALAVECAAGQGSFASFHATLFANQDSLGSIPWPELAQRARVRDLRQFEHCLGTRASAGRVSADLEAAAVLGLRSTPSIIVDGLLLASIPRTLDALTRTMGGSSATASERIP